MFFASALLSPVVPAEEPGPEQPDKRDVLARADAIVSQITPEEKAGQLSQFFWLTRGDEISESVKESLRKGEIGSLLFVTDPKVINAIQKTAVEGSRLHIPVLFGFDVIHGFRTIFPVPVDMAASWDPLMVEQAQAMVAAEARAVGIHWAFAPMIDIARDPRWGASSRDRARILSWAP